jgi:hypothetical protein
VLVPLLLEGASSTTRRERATLFVNEQRRGLPALSWVVRHPPGDERIVRSVGWDGDGHCLVASTQGLEYWNGSEWKRTAALDLPLGSGPRFVRRVAAGRWLVGGDAALIAEYSHSGVSRVMRGKDPSVVFVDASGNVADLAVVVGLREGAAPELWAAVGGRWLRPLSVTDAAYIADLAQLDDERWLVVGRNTLGGGFAAIYSPLAWSLEYLPAPPTRAWVACAARAERDTALAVGADGSVLRIEQGHSSGYVIGQRPNLASIALDVLDRAWAGGSGELWCSHGRGDWTRVFQHPSWERPFISIFADVASVVALGVDGAVLECRPALASHGADATLR